MLTRLCKRMGMLMAAVAGPSALMAQTPTPQPGSVEATDRPAGVMAEPAPVEDAISGSFGIDYSSHFISYGLDVWANGDDWDRPSVFTWGELVVDFDAFTVKGGFWTDINDNTDSAIGGDLQEVDWYVGIGTTVDRFSFGVTYQNWIYGDLNPSEKVLDLSVGFDDTGLIFEDFAFNPSFVAHKRLEGGGLGDEWAFVASINPGFKVFELAGGDVTLSFPTSVAFFEEGFHGGDSGFGFVSIGPKLSVPLAFIPSRYGGWTLTGSVIYYHTEEDVIPNPEDDFIVGQVGVSVAF